jgi:Dictyostelium (slime mold) repeat
MRSGVLLLASAAFVAGFFVLSSVAVAAPAKVEVCHRPPGNPGNSHTIIVNERALPAHLAHGDTVGDCVSGCREDSECDDGNLCTDDVCRADGTCASETVDCDDGNVCTLDSCDASQGCLTLPNDGAVCDDGSDCTQGDTCLATECSGTPVEDCCVYDADCEDGDLCSSDFCSAGECFSEPKDCSLDSVCGVPGLENACLVGFCDPVTGACSTAETNCDDGDICTVDLCDATVGCFWAPRADPPEERETSCSDGLDNDCDGNIDQADPDCMLN